MPQPTAAEIRTFLEGYSIDSTCLTDAWIDNRMTNFIVPFIEKKIRRSIEGVTQVVEYISGNGKSIVFLSRKPIASLVQIEYVTGGDYQSTIGLGGVELIADQGIIKSIANITEGGYNLIFAKGERNIKVTYTVGSATIEIDLKEALIYLGSEQALGFIGARTGGGSINVQGFSRNFGERGKYQDLRNDLSRDAIAILKGYISHIVG